MSVTLHLEMCLLLAHRMRSTTGGNPSLSPALQETQLSPFNDGFA